jgi:putative ABC transport system permease protein
MLKNFFKTAVRNVLKNKAYALINFFGLTCGISLALLIIIYVRSEVSYDKFHTKIDRLYRIAYGAPNGMNLASTPPPIAPRMKEFFPEVEEAGRIYRRSVTISRMQGEESFEENDVAFIDSTIMDMLSFEFVRGNPRRPLRDEFTVHITQ